jgi:hypothetical protein
MKAGTIGAPYGNPVLKWRVVSVRAARGLTRGALHAERGMIERDFHYRVNSAAY